MAFRFTITATIAAFFATPASADIILNRDQFADSLGTRQSSFLALDMMTGERCVLEGSDLEQQHAPWSTFKIPNTLIGLETGAASSIDHWRDWDPAVRPPETYWPEAWRQGQTLKTAFQRSSAWYFQDLALDVGAARYREQLQDWNYGNAATPDGSDSFWLGGPLKVSVAEKVGFLKNLLTGALEIEEAHLATLIDISNAGQFGRFSLHGKTGSGPVQPGVFSGAFEGWYAGWLMDGETATVVFAHHAQGENFGAIRTFRLDFAQELLSACGMNGDED